LKGNRALRAVYNNLKSDRRIAARSGRVGEEPGEYTISGQSVLDLALKIDAAVKRVRPNGWRGIQTREQVIKAALHDILQDEAEVERMFLIIKAQGEY
jgi:type I restriction enzyme R subunit